MNKMRRIADFINVIMISLCISAPLMTLSCVINSADLKGYCILLLGITVVMTMAYLLRVYARKITGFLIRHLILMFITYQVCALSFNKKIALDISYAICWLILTFVVFVVDLAFWISAVNEEKNLPVSETGEPIKGFKPIYKEGLSYISVYFVAIFPIMSLLGILQGYDGLLSNMYIAGISYTILYIIRKYLRNISGLIEIAELGNNVTQKRLIKANTQIVVPLIIIMILAMMAYRSEVTAEMIRTFLAFLLKIIAYVVVFILMLFSGEDVEEAEEKFEMGMDMTQGENPLWLDAIFKGFEYLLGAAIIVAVLHLLIKFILQIFNHYMSRSTNKLRRHQYEDMTEVSEHIEPMRNKNGRIRRSVFSRMSERERIRFLYRKLVIKFSKDGIGVLKMHTPNERLKYILEVTENEPSAKSRSTQLVNITPQYNEARYSKEEIREKN